MKMIKLLKLSIILLYLWVTGICFGLDNEVKEFSITVPDSEIVEIKLISGEKEFVIKPNKVYHLEWDNKISARLAFYNAKLLGRDKDELGCLTIFLKPRQDNHIVLSEADLVIAKMFKSKNFGLSRENINSRDTNDQLNKYLEATNSKKYHIVIISNKDITVTELEKCCNISVLKPGDWPTKYYYNITTYPVTLIFDNKTSKLISKLNTDSIDEIKYHLDNMDNIFYVWFSKLKEFLTDNHEIAMFILILLLIFLVIYFYHMISLKYSNNNKKGQKR